MALAGRVHHGKGLKKARQYYVEAISNMPSDESVHQITQQTGGGDCPCGSPQCPPCILAKTERNIHERA